MRCKSQLATSRLLTARFSVADRTMAVTLLLIAFLVSVECPRVPEGFYERDLDVQTWTNLGCFVPFNIAGGYTSSTVDVTSCRWINCNSTNNFYVVRGGQCICLKKKEATRIDDSYCNLQCKTPGYQCGGNFGANIYCNEDDYPDCTSLRNQTIASAPYPTLNEFHQVAHCLNLSCGLPPSKGPNTFFEYFPNMTTKDCVTFCTYRRKPYAFLGWRRNSQNVSVPHCACSDAKLSTQDPCDGYCYDVESNAIVDQPCGLLTDSNSSWAVFCTTYVDGTECAPFGSSSADVCSMIEPLNNSSSKPNCPQPLFNYTSEDIQPECDQGPCGSRSSCFFNGSCYRYIGVDDSKTSRDFQETADQRCQEANDGGRLLVIESKEEQTFVANAFRPFNQVAPFLLTAGRLEDDHFYWFTSDSNEQIDVGFPEWIDVSQVIIDTSNCLTGPAYLYLGYSLSSSGYTVWNISCANITKQLCQYPPECSYNAPPSSSTPGRSTSDTSTATVSIFWTYTPEEPETTTTTPEVTGVPVNCIENETYPDCDANICDVCSHKYFRCVNGIPTQQFCPEGEVFHPEERQCVKNDTCAVNGETTSEPSSGTTVQTSTPSTISPSTTAPSTTPTSTVTPSTSTTSTTTSTSTTSTTTTSTSTTSTSAPSTNRPDDICRCRQVDVYGYEWTGLADEWVLHSCAETVPDAEGSAGWFCRGTDDGGCAFDGDQPNFSDCHSQSLQDISNNVGNDSLDLLEIWAALNRTTRLNNTYFGHEIPDILQVALKLLDRQQDEFQQTEESLWRQIQTQMSGTQVIGNVVANDRQWRQLHEDNRSSNAIQLLDLGEDIVFRLTMAAETLNKSLQCETRSDDGYVILTSSFWNGFHPELAGCDLEMLTSSLSENILRFPKSHPSGSFLQLPDGSISQGRIHAGAGILIHHPVLDSILPGRTNSFGGRNKQFNSPLVSYTLKHAPPSIFEDDHVYLYYEHKLEAKSPPVRNVRRNLKPGEVPSPVIGSSACAFLQPIAPERPEWHWSNDGCSLVSYNRTHTVCKCNHLTGFANLMDFHNYTGLTLGLEVTSLVCSSLSVVALITTLVLLSVLKAIKNDRTVITQNLCGALMLSHILVLTTLNKNYFQLDDISCAVFGIVLHLSLLVSFMWMTVEGLRLCHLVIDVFNQQKRKWTWLYLVVAYGVPSVIVGTTVLVANFSDGGVSFAYVGDETCWLSGGSYKWAFAGPVALLLLLNVGFIIVAVHFSWNLKKNDTKNTGQKVKNSARLCLSLTGLLGISWLTGYFMYVESDVFAYIFTISNGLQGVVILLFRCLLNNSVRAAIKDQWRRKRRNNKLKREVGQQASTANVTRRKPEASTDDPESKGQMSLPAARINSKMSVWSNMTRSTDLSSLSSDSTSANRDKGDFFVGHRHTARTFSGTEFSESSSEGRNSICSGLSLNSTPSFVSTVKADYPHFNY